MPAAPLIAEARILLRLAWPVILTSLNWTLLALTDVVVVGQAGTMQVAAFGASRTITYVAIVAGLAALSGTLVMVSRADGAGDKLLTGEVLRQGLLLGLGLGVVAMVVLLVGADAMLLGIGVEPDLVPVAAAVVRVMAVAYPAQFVSIAASFYLEGISRPRRVMEVNLITLPINALFAWALSGGHFGLPALGAVGAAIATTGVSWLGAALMLRAAWSDSDDRGVQDIARDAWVRARKGVLALASFGAIPALASALELAGFSWLIALSTQLGDTTAHAFQIVFSLHNFTFGLALGLGSAAGVRVGNAVGAGEAHLARSRTLIAVGLSIVLTAIAALVLALGATPIAAAFPATADVRVLAAAMLVVWAPFVIFDGMQVVFTYALRSLGDQIAAGINGILAFFVVTGGLGWWLVATGMGPFALVWASGLGMVAAAFLQGARLLWTTSSARLRMSG